MPAVTPKVAAIIPNLNGQDFVLEAVKSLKAQSLHCDIIVVDNGSTDGSLEKIRALKVVNEIIALGQNHGFAGGVNAGLRHAIERGYQYALLLNNDATLEQAALSLLVRELQTHQDAGIATCKILTTDGDSIDSTGDFFSIWGLPEPRGRGQRDSGQFDEGKSIIFGASGGASLYRLKMLEQIDLFDEDYFAYYEDVDLSFRAQLVGWQVRFVASARAYHQIGATSSRMKGFTTYHSFKNLPWLTLKNVPKGLLKKVLPRLWFAYTLFFWSAVFKGNGWYALKGYFASLRKLPKKLHQRRLLQKQRTVSPEYISSIIIHDVPESYTGLRKLLRKNR